MSPAGWRIRRSAPGGLQPWVKLAREAGIPEACAHLAWLRGEDQVEDLAWRLDASWTRPFDPFLLEDMGAAVARIRRALAERERIVIYGDYDADGVTATALLARTLAHLGGTPETFIPNRFSDGYGLSLDCIRELAEAGPGLFVSVDCGVRSVEEVRASRERGIAWVVTDHHALGAERPEAEAIVHPALGEYPNPHLSGAGVAFKLAQALLDAAPAPFGSATAFLDGLLKLVALGTIADVVPLTGENAWLVKRGLRAMGGANGPGLQALLDVAKVQGIPRAAEVAFSLAPRLNAVGRMGGAEEAVQLLLSRDRAEAAALADRAEEKNRSRKAVQADLLNRLPPPGLEPFELLVDPEAHKGVLGIAAGQRMRLIGRPVGVGTLESGIVACSLRAPVGYDLTLLIERARPWLRSGGGHKAAAGMTFPLEALPFVRRALERGAAEQALARPAEEGIFDGPATAGVPSASDLALLEPFGAGFPEPLFAWEGRLVRTQAFGQGHTKVFLEGHPEPFTWFDGAAKAEGWTGRPARIMASPQDHPRWGRSWRVEDLQEGGA